MNNHALIDWISFSLPIAYSEQNIGPVILELFNRDFSSFSHDYRKQKFYRQRHALQSDLGNTLLHIFLEPDTANNRDTSAFTVTGYALSDRPDALQVDPVQLLRKVKDMGGQLTRLDCALDDYSGKPVLQQMIDSSRPDTWKDRIVSPLRFKAPVCIWEQTIYYGHRSKGNSIAAYDKAAETGTPGPGFRCEFRARERTLLDQLLIDICSGRPVGEITAGLIKAYLMFKPPGRKTKYNRPDCQWWLDYLGAAETYKLTRHRSGKADDEPRKAPGKAAFERYLKEAFAADETGEFMAITARLLEETRQARTEREIDF